MNIQDKAVDRFFSYLCIGQAFIIRYNYAVRAVSLVETLERDILIRVELSRFPHEILILEWVRKGKFIILCSSVLATYNQEDEEASVLRWSQL